MTRLLIGHDKLVADWVGLRLGETFHPPYAAVGVIKDECLVGGIVFNSYQGANIDLTVYGHHCWSRGLFRRMAEYVFVQLGCTRVTAKTRKKNKKARVALEKLGFMYEGNHQRYWGPNRSDDALLYGLLAENCPWLEKITHGQHSQAA